MAGMVVAAAALAAPGSAAAAPNVCTASTVPSTMRSEGLTDLAGDIVLDCIGGTPTTSGTAIPVLTLSVNTSSAPTSRVLAPNWTEAEALVDDPAPNTQSACNAANGVCTVNGTGTGNGVYDGSAGRPNVYQGTLVGPNQINFSIPLDAPASGGTRRIRIVSLRVNATQVPLTNGFGQSVAALSIPTLAINNPIQTIGFVQSGLTVAARTPDGSAPLTSPTQLSPCDANQRALTMRFQERFASAFRQRAQTTTDPASPLNQNVPGATNFLSESGFFNSSLVGNLANRGDLRLAGLADSGTRLHADFAGVPAGSQLYVPSTVTLSPLSVMVRTPNEGGAFAPVLPIGDGPAGTAAVPVGPNGSATVFYEVLRANDTAVDAADVPVFVTPGGTAGTATVAGGFAPRAPQSVPRFTGGSPPTSAFTVVPCPQPAVTPPETPTTTVTVTNTITTPGATVTVPVTPTPEPKGASTGALSAKRVAIDQRGHGSLPVRCDGGSDCDFRLTLTGATAAARRKTATLGVGSGHVAAGQSGTVAITLKGGARRALGRTGKLSAQLKGTVTSAGTSAPLTGRVALQGRRQK
jgi:hypothetical protein